MTRKQHDKNNIEDDGNNCGIIIDYAMLGWCMVYDAYMYGIAAAVVVVDIVLVVIFFTTCLMTTP